ncbi:MAG: hypothetical protein KGL39_18760 [Patescibacteria group bacterium]|nr:hypothetical protein [Patescibacteria group bacterium]
MTWVAVGVGVGGSVIGGALGAQGSSNQANAMRDALQYQREVGDQARQDLAPYRAFGSAQLKNFTDWLNNPNNNPSAFLDPGYAFRLNQGNKGIESNAATAGLLQSGDTLRGLTQYGQDAASQEYNNAFNRYLGMGDFKRTNALVGENAATLTGQLGNQGAGNIIEGTANTNFGGADQAWANTASGLGGFGANMLAKRLQQGQTMPPSIPGGSFVFDSQPFA